MTTLAQFLGQGVDPGAVQFDEQFAAALLPFLMAAPQGSIFINSGYRSPEAQASIIASNWGNFDLNPADRARWEADVAQFGAIEAGRRWAPVFTGARRLSDGSPFRNWIGLPGSSNHQHGHAADLGYTGEGQAWAHANAADYGLNFRLGNEPWHIELAGRAPSAGGGGGGGPRLSFGGAGPTPADLAALPFSMGAPAPALGLPFGAPGMAPATPMQRQRQNFADMIASVQEQQAQDLERARGPGIAAILNQM